MEEKRYTILEISEKTGYSLRTIRYYVQEGLLPPPAGRGRGGFYFDSHLEKLNQIKALQEKGVELNSILGFLRKGQVRQPDASRNVWARYEVIPGLEINVRRDIEDREGKKVFDIVRIAKSIAGEVREND